MALIMCFTMVSFGQVKQNTDSMYLDLNSQVKEINLRLEHQEYMSKKANANFMQGLLLSSIGSAILISNRKVFQDISWVGYGFFFTGTIKITISQLQIFNSLKKHYK